MTDEQKQAGTKIYDDALCEVFMPDKKTAIGHLRVIAKNNALWQDLTAEQYTHVMLIANSCASVLFQLFEAHGTNIIQNTIDSNSFSVDVIARMQEDGKNYMWTPAKADQADLTDAHSKIKDKCFYIGKKVEIKEPIKQDEPEKLDETKQDYIIKSLTRLP